MSCRPLTNPADGRTLVPVPPNLNENFKRIFNLTNEKVRPRIAGTQESHFPPKDRLYPKSLI